MESPHSIAPTAELAVPVRCCSRCRVIYRSDYLRCPADGGEIVLRDGDPLIGATVGEHYVIEALVGEGAMGRVYRARHLRLERRAFAVKVLIGDFASTLAMRLRFAQEADAASALDHPNVVSVVDFGTDAGLLYLVMDFVEGPMLGEVIADEGALPAERVVTLARAMLNGLAHAHDRGLIHRDFKPDNVIVAHGVPRILDFGLAIAADPTEGAARLTSVGATVGTPIYAAPEQAATGVVDHRADLFALGVTMYEMLAGVAPFTGNTPEILYRNATETPPPIGERAPGVQVPPALEAIVVRLMAKDPADRYASARDAIAALDACDLSPAPPAVVEPVPPAIEAPPPAVEPRARSRRGPAIAVAIGAIGIAIAGLAYVRSRDRAPARAPVEPPPAAGSTVVLAAETGEPAPVEPAPIAAPPIDAPSIAAPPIATAPPPGSGSAGRGSSRPVRPPAIDRTPPPVEPPPIETPAAVPVDAAPPPPAAPVDAAPARVATPAVDAAVRPPVAVAPPPLLLSAAVSFDRLEVDGGLSNTTVRRALERAGSSLRGCYRAAARAAGRSPADSVQISLTIDEQGLVHGVRGSGAALPDLAACSARALGGLRAATPDVGTVQVTATIKFRPEAP